MDPAGKEISMDVAIKMMNDQAHYEVKRNVCLAVLLYFGTLSPEPWLTLSATGMGLYCGNSGFELVCVQSSARLH